ncbi:MAG: IMP dehydrogenase [Anaerolineales bacterium]|jgi:IMP dehydrogenase|nr:IMP dehydrogenase [Anaerolineales bacterium]
MHIRETPGLTFDDVLLVPRRSSIASRSAVDTSARLARHLRLAIPIISANMDTVTEADMAIAMALAGGMGAIHRFMTHERQAAEVARVKRAESFVVESPATISPDASVTQARQMLHDLGIGGLLVTGPDGALLGMLTNRDILLAPDPLAPLSSVMTPREQLITLTACGPQCDDLERARQLLHAHRIEKLPLLNEHGRVIGLVTAQDIIKHEQYPLATKDSKGRLCVAAAVGVKPGDLIRSEACVAAGADALVVDIAHGHSDHAIQVVRELKQSFPHTEIIAGNVATAAGVQDLVEAGADAVKVGVGSGSICTTRIVTGFGVPQLTALIDCAVAARAADVPLIADGGIRNGGDLTKALAAGANTAMIGSLLAGTEESPGASVVRDGRRYKIVRGMASLSANIERKMVEKGGEVDLVDWEQVVPEGVEALVPYRGAVIDLLHQLVGGLRSGLSYAGATNITELQEKAEFIQITGAGMRESGSHDVETIG